MRKSVRDFIVAQNNLLKDFNVDNDFYIKPLTNHTWRLIEDEDWYIVSYWGKDTAISEAAVAKRSGKPLIIRKREYTLVVAIECVRVGLIFRNENEVKALGNN